MVNTGENKVNMISYFFTETVIVLLQRRINYSSVTGLLGPVCNNEVIIIGLQRNNYHWLKITHLSLAYSEMAITGLQRKNYHWPTVK